MVSVKLKKYPAIGFYFSTDYHQKHLGIIPNYNHNNLVASYN